MLDSSQLYNLVIINSLGLTVVCEALRTAHYYVAHTNSVSRKSAIAGSESLAYIAGTGLDMTMIEFYMDYDPDNLRRSFFTMINKRDEIND